MRENIIKSVAEAIRAIHTLELPATIDFMQAVAKLLADCFRNGNKVLIAGNGGSLCDAAHFAEECTGQFRKPRPALPVIALTEPGHLSCVGNDYGFDWVFARGVEAYGKPGDLFIALSTSGNSSNLIKALQLARKKGLQTVTFLGRNGGKMRGMADLELVVEGFSTSDRIQEVHMAALHLLIEAVEALLFGVEGSQSFPAPSLELELSVAP